MEAETLAFLRERHPLTVLAFDDKAATPEPPRKSWPSSRGPGHETIGDNLEGIPMAEFRSNRGAR